MARPALIRFIVVACVLMVIATAVYQALTWNLPGRQFRRAIAIEHSNHSSDDFGDYGHIVVGRITDVPFEDLAVILKLPSHTTKPLRAAEPDASGWHLFPELTWWKIPDQFDEIYYDLGPGSQCLLGRRGDRVYLQDLTW